MTPTRIITVVLARPAAFVLAAAFVGVFVGGCGPTQTVDNDTGDIEEIAPDVSHTPPNPAEPEPIAPPEEVVVEDAPPEIRPETAGSPPAWWQDEPTIIDGRILVFATADADSLLDARAQAIDAAARLLETEHDAEPIAGEVIISTAQLDDGRIRVWIRMAGRGE